VERIVQLLVKNGITTDKPGAIDSGSDSESNSDSSYEVEVP
jgi:hypothetical protein